MRQLRLLQPHCERQVEAEEPIDHKKASGSLSAKERDGLPSTASKQGTLYLEKTLFPEGELVEVHSSVKIMEAGHGTDEHLMCATPLNLHPSVDRKIFTEHNIYFNMTAPRWCGCVLAPASSVQLEIGSITVG